MRKESPTLPNPEEIQEEVVTDDVAIKITHSGYDDEIRRRVDVLGRYYLINTVTRRVESDNSSVDLGVEYGWQSRHREGLVRPDRIRIPGRERVWEFLDEIRYPTIKEISNKRILEIAYEYEQAFEQNIYEK